MRPPSWKWAVCGLLLLATMLNYMDRLTLNQMSLRIKEDFELDNKGYGWLESAFGLAFAAGAICGGWMVDRWNVRWVYPTAVLFWSAAGGLTGLVTEYNELLLCRIMLGFFEAIHWPCALRTTQRILSPDQRTMGNSILQSGAAVGAIVTPLIVLALLDLTGTWRYPFVVIGGLGLLWVVLWLILVKPADLALPQSQAPGAGAGGAAARESLAHIFLQKRFLVLVILVVSINITWHFFRVWMPLFLQTRHKYTETFTQFFTSAYYLSTDAGSLLAGLATLGLVRRGWSVHGSRVMVFSCCALLTCLSVLAASLPPGKLLLAVLLIIGFGALGLFPNYYSFSQELTVKRQGILTGTLGCVNWIAMAQLHLLVGGWVDRTQSYTLPIALVGLMPLVAVAALLLLWGKKEVKQA